MREGNSITGKPLKDENGKTIMQPGTLREQKQLAGLLKNMALLKFL